MKKWIKWSMILVGIFIISCKVDSQENSGDVDLGGNYRLIHSAVHTDLAIVKKDNIQVVGGNIINYAFDANFIVAAQNPRDSSLEQMMTMPAKEYDEYFEKSNLRLYWIIDKRKVPVFDTANIVDYNVYGPFTKEEYLSKRKALDIPQTLKFKLVN